MGVIAIRNQLKTLKDNWLLIVIGLIILFMISGGSAIFQNIATSSSGYYADTAMSPRMESNARNYLP